MKLLLDESLPRALKHLFSGHDVETVPECGWAGLSNGELLRLAETRFDTFITADQNLQYQQNLAGFDIGVLVLSSSSTRVSDIEILIPRALQALDDLRPGEVKRIAL